MIETEGWGNLSAWRLECYLLLILLSYSVKILLETAIFLVFVLEVRHPWKCRVGMEVIFFLLGIPFDIAVCFCFCSIMLKICCMNEMHVKFSLLGVIFYFYFSNGPFGGSCKMILNKG